MKISVIIPAYNAEQYIAKAIESCLEQTIPPDEIIVADDCSTDRTAEIAAGFPAPVRLLRLEKNSGVPVARNRAVEASTGDWLAFLDADDWFLPRKLELQRRCIAENPNAVVVYCKVRMQFADGTERDCVFVPPEAICWWLRYACPPIVSAAMVRRDAFESVGKWSPEHRSAEDWDLWLKVAERYPSAAFAAVPETLTMYRQVSGSLSADKLRIFKEENIPLIETRSLYRTAGLKRLLLRRKILAYHYFDMATILREQGSDQYFSHILTSLALWPLPFPRVMLPLKRYKFAAVMLAQHLGWWPNAFRSGNQVPIGHHNHGG